LDPRVRIVSVPSEKIAILRFSGYGGDYRQRQSELISTLAGSKWRPVGETFMLYYDAPFTLPFLRRNEAAVVVEEMS
jgi:DNA gyrase inhibitor GyrI